MKKRFTIVVVSGLFLAIIFMVSGILVISSGTSFSESAEPSSEKELLEMLEKSKESPEAHEAVASYYRSQAEALKQKAKQHETMTEKYKSVMGKGSFATHCQTLSEYYKKAAEENEVLAKEHEEMAKSLSH